jgi:hypothetical protein
MLTGPTQVEPTGLFEWRSLMLGTFGKTTGAAGTCRNKSTVQTQFPKGGCLTGTDRVAAAILARSGMNLVDVMSKAGNSFQTCTGLTPEMNGILGSDCVRNRPVPYQ